MAFSGIDGRTPIRMYYGDSWRCQPPRPTVSFPERDLWCELYSVRRGDIDFTNIVACGNRAPAVLILWSRHLQSRFPNKQEESLYEFLSLICSVPALESLEAQLLVAISRRVQLYLGKSAKSGSSHDEVSNFTILPSMPTPDDPQMEQKLVAYVKSCHVYSRPWTTFGIATDKASPCLASLANSCVKGPTHVVMIACPLVLIPIS